MKHKVVIRYLNPYTGDLDVKSCFIDLPADARVEFVELQEPRKVQFVLVSFYPNNYKKYKYRCDNARVGDWVIVPPSDYNPNYQVVKVKEVGYSFETTCDYKTAILLPSGVME